MRHIKYLGGAVLAGLLALPVTAFAKDKNEGNLMLSAPVQVGSTQLQPGSYKVEWQGSGPAVNADILQDDKTVATAAAKLVAYTEGYDAVVTGPAAGDPQKTAIQEIDFGKQKEGLQLIPSGQK